MAGKTDIIDHVAGSADGLTKRQVTEVFDAIFDTISNSLSAGDRVAITGFGSFQVRERAARQGRNPQTGATITIAASKNVGFKAGKELKEKVNA